MGQKQVFATALTDVYYNSTFWKEAPGTIRVENNATYKFVAFSGATAVAAGDVVGYVAAASDGNAQIVDDLSTTLAAGVAMAAVAAGTKTSGAVAYAQGWVQIKGLTALSTSIQGASTVVGANFGYPVVPSGTSSIPGVALISGTASIAATQQTVGWFYASKTILSDFPY